MKTHILIQASWLPAEGRELTNQITNFKPRKYEYKNNDKHIASMVKNPLGNMS